MALFFFLSCDSTNPEPSINRVQNVYLNSILDDVSKRNIYNATLLSEEWFFQSTGGYSLEFEELILSFDYDEDILKNGEINEQFVHYLQQVDDRKNSVYVVWRADMDFNQNDYLGYTSISKDGTRIIIIDFKGFFSSLNPYQEIVLTHELGHALGMNHTSAEMELSNLSVMSEVDLLTDLKLKNLILIPSDVRKALLSGLLKYNNKKRELGFVTNVSNTKEPFEGEVISSYSPNGVLTMTFIYDSAKSFIWLAPDNEVFFSKRLVDSVATKSTQYYILYLLNSNYELFKVRERVSVP